MRTDLADTPSLADQSEPRRPDILAWLRFARVFHKMDRNANDRFRCFGLSDAQFDVLVHIGAAEGLTQQELADTLLVTKGNVCQLLDRMERTELIVRRQEGRANRLFLSAAGRKLFDEVVPAHENAIVDLMSCLSDDEQMHLLELLGKLDRALG